MKLINRQTLANTVYKRWTRQNPQAKGKLENVGEMLRSLGNYPNPNKVDEVIGNNSWTIEYHCNECGKQGQVVEIGEKPGYDSNTAYICKECHVVENNKDNYKCVGTPCKEVIAYTLLDSSIPDMIDAVEQQIIFLCSLLPEDHEWYEQRINNHE